MIADAPKESTSLFVPKISGKQASARTDARLIQADGIGPYDAASMASPTALSTALNVPPKNTSRITARAADNDRIRPYSTMPWPRCARTERTERWSRIA